jgi:WD40 repeat protein
LGLTAKCVRRWCWGRVIDAEADHVILDPPLGSSLLSGDLAGTIKIWSVQTGRFLCDLAHLERKIERIEFSPSGRYLAYSAYHGPLVMYDLRRLQAGD